MARVVRVAARVPADPTARRRALPPPPLLSYESSPGAASSTLAGTYRRREPERSLLYRTVARELPTFERSVREQSPYGRGLPSFIEKELHAFLDCGLLSRGFARLRCDRCHEERPVAFSRKGRGVCPSCTTRRMNDTAAHLVDRVIPYVSVRPGDSPR